MTPIQIKSGQSKTLQIQWLDEANNPTPDPDPGRPYHWQADVALVTITPTDQPGRVVIQAIGPVGSSAISVSSVVSGRPSPPATWASGQIDVIAGDAVNAQIVEVAS